MDANQIWWAVMSRMEQPKSYKMFSFEHPIIDEEIQVITVKWSADGFECFLWVVTQSCPTLCDPMGCSPPGSSATGILQTRIPEWVAVWMLQGECFLNNAFYPNLSPGGAIGQEPTCQCRRHKKHGSIPGSGRSPGEGHGNPLQYSCLENPMERGSWWATVHGVAQSQTEVT